MKKLKKNFFDAIELDGNNRSYIDEYYSYFMIGAIILSLILLFTRERNTFLILMVDIILVIFIIDYLLEQFSELLGIGD